MFFTEASRIVAWIGAVLGLLVTSMGYEISINRTASIFVDVLPYLTTPQRAAEQGDVFRDQGSVVLFYSLVLGVLTEISRSVSGRGEE